MADYGVPDEPEGLLDWQWAEERLENSRNFWISTVSRGGRVHSMPVWGVWLADTERFWFSCAPSARKARNLAENPSIVVAPTDTVEVVSLEGVARPATDDALDSAVGTYISKYGEEMGEEPAAIEEFMRSNPGYEVVPERAFGMIERAEDFARCATRWRWA